MICVESNDGVHIEVEKDVIFLSRTINNIIDDMGSDSCPIPLDVPASILLKIVELCRQHSKGLTVEIDVNAETLWSIYNSANYLDISFLMDVCGQTFANRMHGKSLEKARSVLGILSDFTPNEFRCIEYETEWC